MTDKMLNEAKEKNSYIVTERVLKSVPNKYCELPISIVDSFSAVQELLGNFFETQPYEVVYAIALDSSNRFLGFIKISEGTVNRATLYPRTIFTFLLCETNATGLILAHNHPGGKLEPSVDDINLTKKLKESLKDIDVRLLDHVIYAPANFGTMPRWLSLLEQGYM